MISSVQQIKNVGTVIANSKTHQKAITENLPKSIKALGKAKDFLGTELSSILITAAGTGLVAPVFIANNPLAKTDKETKQYSALRQPVSAVISVLMQAGIIIPFNKFLDKKINEGALGALYDKSTLQDASHIAKKIKKSMPKISKTDLVKKTEDTILEQTKKAMKKLADAGFNGDLLDMVKKNANKISSNVRWLKALTGLAIGVATVPISCTLLNWTYPKFVEKFFPHLCKDKGKCNDK